MAISFLVGYCSRFSLEFRGEDSENFTLKIVGFVMLLQPVDRSCLGKVFSFLLTT